jgi:hypothetical protein
MKKNLVALLAFALAGFAGSAGAQTFVSANVTTNTTWGGGANPSPIILQNPIFVKGGATLTILPGTIVRGQPRSSAVVPGSTVGTPGALIVTQTGRIVANGSPTTPIIMTTAATDNDNDGIADDVDTNGFKDRFDPGDIFLDDTPATAPLAPLDKAGRSNVSLWGGLVILGSAPTNNAAKGGVGYGKVTIEGLTVPGFPPADATYGGVEPHDNSGLLRYVSIRHAGDEIGEGNELNGLSLGAVGDGTTLESIEIYCNFDDGIEWFGGTVNGKNLAVFFVGDDMFDLDEGYTGINQFLFGVMPFFNENSGAAYGSASGDKAGEFDGDNYRPDAVALFDNVNTRIDITNSVVDPTPWPLSNPAMYNMTLIGSTPDAGQNFVPVSPASTNRGIQFRNGFAGTVHNSIVVNTGAETGIEVGSGTGAPGFGVVDNANAGLISLVCSTLDDGAALAADEITVVNNGNALNLALGGSAAGVNVTNGSFAGLTVEDQTFNPTGNAAGKIDSSLKAAPINPRATGLAGVGSCTSPRGPGLDSGATFRGAFLRTAPTLWTTGWTAMNVGGLLAN